jgi:hypothetical protein
VRGHGAGEQLTSGKLLRDPSDVFYLDIDELLRDGLTRPVASVERRTCRGDDGPR